MCLVGCHSNFKDEMFEMTMAPWDIIPDPRDTEFFVYAQRGCNTILAIIMIILFCVNAPVIKDWSDDGYSSLEAVMICYIVYRALNMCISFTDKLYKERGFGPLLYCHACVNLFGFIIWICLMVFGFDSKFKEYNAQKVKENNAYLKSTDPKIKAKYKNYAFAELTLLIL